MSLSRTRTAAVSFAVAVGAFVLAAVADSSQGSGHPVRRFVPADAEFVLSAPAALLAPGASWRQLLPLLLGDSGLLDHPDAVNLRRFVVAGSLVPTPRWTFAGAEGLFVSSPDPYADFFGPVPGVVAYDRSVPVLPGQLPVYRTAFVRRDGDGLSLLAGLPAVSPLVAVATDAADGSAPPAWLAFRLDRALEGPVSFFVSGLLESVPFFRGAVVLVRSLDVLPADPSRARFALEVFLAPAADAAAAAGNVALFLEWATAAGGVLSAGPVAVDGRRLHAVFVPAPRLFGRFFEVVPPGAVR